MASPELQAVLDALAAGPAFGRPGPSPQEQRRAYIEEAKMYRLPEGVSVSTVNVESDGDGESVSCEWLVAADAHPARRALYFHGGGYMVGNLDTHRDLAAAYSKACRCAVLAVDYRLAPEHPFPAALDDARTAFRWMRRNGPAGPAPAESTFLLGDSAGGGLALALLLALRDAGDPPANAAAVASAWTDVAMTGETVRNRADRDLRIIVAGIQPMADAYLAGADPTNPLISPLYGDLHGLPPLLMQVGEEEVLLDDTRRFVAKARQAGVDVAEEIWPDVYHVWHHRWATIPEAQQAVDRIGEFVQQQIGAVV